MAKAEASDWDHVLRFLTQAAGPPGSDEGGEPGVKAEVFDGGGVAPSELGDVKVEPSVDVKVEVCDGGCAAGPSEVGGAVVEAFDGGGGAAPLAPGDVKVEAFDDGAHDAGSAGEVRVEVFGDVAGAIAVKAEGADCQPIDEASAGSARWSEVMRLMTEAPWEGGRLVGRWRGNHPGLPPEAASAHLVSIQTLPNLGPQISADNRSLPSGLSLIQVVRPKSLDLPH